MSFSLSTIINTLKHVEHLLCARAVIELHLLPVDQTADVEGASPQLTFTKGHLGIPIPLVKYMYQQFYKPLLTLEIEDDITHIDLFILMCNPNISTLWNRRKDRIISKSLTPEEELYFTRLVLCLHPKCATLYEHRRWVLRQYAVLSNDQVEEELGLCLETAGRYKNNYYSWSHRLFVISSHNKTSILLNDLVRVRKWRETHISEYGAFTHCQYLVKHLGYSHRDLQEEYDNTLDLISFYPNRESLWLHRRWVVSCMSHTKAQEFATILQNEKLVDDSDYFSQRYVKTLRLLLTDF